MEVHELVSLQPYNTFGLEAKAQYFAAVDSVAGFQEVFQDAKWGNVPRLILGGGSNILLTKDVAGLVIRNELKGIELIRQDNDHLWVKAGAGENWHQFVQHCVANGWAGIENLSLIPGNIGAGPMQNIGAYGTELKDVFDSLEALEIATGKVYTFDKTDCQFGYRESVFKRALKDQYVIVSVTLRLNKRPNFNTSYGAIEQELERMETTDLSIKAISQAVINIRSSKLPDPKQIGNAGSFFKNPVIPLIQFESLKERFPEMVSYPVTATEVKLAAGWLIDQAGWKGKRIGQHGVHDRQALVLVNHGGARGQQIYDLSQEILESIMDKYGVQLEREVNII